MPVIKEVKVFTRDNQCTKVDIHNCFAGHHGYIDRAVVEARGDIGLNTPKYLLRKGYAIEICEGNVDYYRLTSAGTVWLHAGLLRHLELHPDDAKLVKPMRQNMLPPNVPRTSIPRKLRAVRPPPSRG